MAARFRFVNCFILRRDVKVSQNMKIHVNVTGFNMECLGDVIGDY